MQPARRSGRRSDCAAHVGHVSAPTGFIPFYWDASKGRLLLEISQFDTDVLYYVSTAASPGSVELGMDRGVDAQKVVHFQRIGPKVLVVEQNLRYRAPAGSRRAEGKRARFVRDVGAGVAADRSGGRRAACWWTPRRSSCATGWAPKRRSASASREHFASIRREAAFTWRARRRFRRTPRSKPS